MVIVIPCLVFGEELASGNFRIRSVFNWEVIGKRLDKDWEVEDGDLAKAFNYEPGAVLERDWSVMGGQTFKLGMDFRPHKNIDGEIDVLTLLNYADRFWMPVNDLHRLDIEKEAVRWTKGRLSYKGDNLRINLFRGIPHHHWKNEGDIFGLYPEQHDIETYLRVGGKPVPQGGEIFARTPLGNFTVVGGPEVVWKGGESIFGRYNFLLFNLSSCITYRNQQIEWGEEDEHLRSGSLLINLPVVGKYPLQLGVLYQPFRLDEEYEYVEETSPGDGILGSKYILKEDKTKEKDAYGFKVKAKTDIIPEIDEATFEYTYLGLVAGNEQELTGLFSRRLSPSMLATLGYIYQEPLEGPLPYLYEGSEDNIGPTVISPRGKDSPFWVNWDNRRANIAKLYLTFDPTPSTPFYKWEPNILEEWNLNPDEDAHISFGLGYSLSYYPTTTDRWYYYNRDGDVIWEGEGDPTVKPTEPRSTGCWATKKPLNSLSLASRLNLPDDYSFLFQVDAGELPALSSICYTTSRVNNKPITQAFKLRAKAIRPPYIFGIMYGEDIWGPEDWHERLGVSFDKVIILSLKRDIGTFSRAGLDYIIVREVDTDYLTDEIGSYDEVRFNYEIRFSMGKSKRVEEYVPSVKDRKPPIAHLGSERDYLIVGGSDIESRLSFFMNAKDNVGIANWRLRIKDENGNSVKAISGEGSPPLVWEWDGTDDYYGKAVPEGIYKAYFYVSDYEKNSSISNPVRIELRRPPKLLIKEIEKVVPEEVTVTEDERGIVLTLSCWVLFDTAKCELKPISYRVLNQIGKILVSYPKNYIMIEGHADSRGSEEYNLNLSEKRAQSVAKYLIETYNIPGKRIKTIGYGESRPIASNATEEGRRNNRRVEVIILKSDK